MLNSKTILITGATGLIGKELVRQCHEAGIAVHYVTTSRQKLKDEFKYKGFYWNPAKGEIDIQAFEGVSAIINLAGASVSKRWTPAYKKEIWESRTQSIRLISETLKNKEHTIEQFISASGISVYPDSLTEMYLEDSSEVCASFLGKVTEAWEAAADEFQDIGIPVAKVRTGIVLAANEGALPKMAKPIRLGVGSPLGTGKQWQSWIHIEDMAGIYLHILLNGIQGVFNGIAPNPVRNHELVAQIARVLKKKLWMPNVPGMVIKTMLGEMGQLALDGQQVSSKKIEQSGYDFKYPTLEGALQQLLK